MGEIFRYWPVLLEGLQTTVGISVLTIVLSAVGALVLGSLRLSRFRAARIATVVLIELIRGPSVLIMLFWVYYAFPMLPGAPKIAPITAAILVLSLAGSAYGAEIVRAGLASIPKGQNEACHALSLSRKNTLFRVILPQALSQIVPGFGSMARDMIKWTSIVSFVGVQDILYAANSVRSETYETTKVFCLLALTYYILTLLCGMAFKASESLLPMNRAMNRAMKSARTPVVAKASADMEGAR